MAPLCRWMQGESSSPFEMTGLSVCCSTHTTKSSSKNTRRIQTPPPFSLSLMLQPDAKTIEIDENPSSATLNTPSWQRTPCAFFVNSKQAFIHLSLRRGFRLATLPKKTPRSVECCTDGCPSGSFYQDLWSSARVTIRFLVISPPVSKHLPFKNYGDHCPLGNLHL